MTDMSKIQEALKVRMSPDHRAAFTKAITAHDGWKAWRQNNGMRQISDMKQSEKILCALELGIDVLAFSGDAPSSIPAETMPKMEEQVIPAPATVPDDLPGEETDARAVATSSEGGKGLRPYGKATAHVLEKYFQNYHPDMKQRDKDFYTNVMRTVTVRQNGEMTENQRDALWRCIGDSLSDDMRQAFDKEMNEAARNDLGTQPAIKTEGNTPMAIPNKDATAQLASLLAGLAANAIDQDEVARIVDARISKALESVPALRIEVTGQDGKVRAVEGHKHPMFTTLLKVLSSRMANGMVPNVWIAGPTGSSKTHSAEMAAKALGLDFYAMGACDMPHELMGYHSPGTGLYVTTPFRNAYEHGGVILLDEIDAYSPSATLAANAALSNSFCQFPDKLVRRHADCVIIGTANTWGLGATADYVGRAKIDAAFLARFPVKLAWPYDVALEVAISGNEAFSRRVIAARERAKAAGLKIIIDPRQSQAGAALIAAGMSEDEAASFTYLAGLNNDQRKIVEGK